MTIHAIYQNGVFVPKEKVDLPDKTPVVFDPKPELPFDENMAFAAMKGILETLDKRVDSGDTNVAEHHNEHQP
jgi:predicted DNA-binding antitoxin AbrB/MazE fold protein